MMALHKPLLVVLFQLFYISFQIKNIQGLRHLSSTTQRTQNVISVIDVNEEIARCQEFRTKAADYNNFFGLDYFQNDKLEDEKFRYKFYVKGDRDIYILFTETDIASSGTRGIEFGIRAYAQTVASTLKLTIGGSEQVRTEEKVPVTGQKPVLVLIIAKNDGEVQMFVDNKPYPILRYPGVNISPKYVSFSTRGNYAGSFYFNCREPVFPRISNSALDIIDDNALPIVYISFKIQSLSRQANIVTVNLAYNMTLYNMYNQLSLSGKTTSEKLSALDAPKFQVPNLKIFSNHVPINRSSPSYNITIAYDNKLTASGQESLQMTCINFPDSQNTLFCNLAFGFEDNKYHLIYYPDGQLLSTSIASFSNVKIYQALNAVSISSIPIKSDIEMKFKFDTRKF